MTIGNKILDLRQNMDMSKEELASKLNVSATIVSKWEIGGELPGEAMLKKISNALNVSITELHSCEDIHGRNKGNNNDFNKIWHYKKYTFLSYILLIASPLLLYFIDLFGSIDRNNFDGVIIINLIMFIVAFFSIIIAITLESLQFIYLLNFFKTKPSQLEYKTTLKKYGITFLILLIISIVSAVLIILL